MNQVLLLIIIISIVINCWLCIILKKESKRSATFKTYSSKHYEMLCFMTRWTRAKQVGKKMEDYFHKNGFQNIAIYGLGMIGETLVDELCDSDVNIIYGIDKNRGDECFEFDVLHPDEVTDNIDVVIVTALFYYDSIKNDLERKLSCPIISLEEVLYGC